MTNWVLNGIRTGIRTSSYPRQPETRGGRVAGPPDRNIVWIFRSRRKLGRTVSDRGNRHDMTAQSRSIIADASIAPDAVVTRATSLSWDTSYEWASDTHDDARPVQKLQRDLRPFAAHSLRRRWRLRRLHERGAANQQSLLQHASPWLFHDADAAQCRCPDGLGSGIGCDAASLA